MRAHLREYFARRLDPYAGAVVEISRRLTGAAALAGGIISLGLLPAAPPTVPIGDPGWLLAALCVAGTLMGAVMTLRSRSTADWNALAAIQWFGLGSLAVLVWLTGGNESPHATLFLLWIVVSAACHPPRRAGVYLIAAAFVTVAPLSYDGAPLAGAGEAAAQLLVWIVMAAVANLWVVSVRSDRLQRILSEQHASTLARIDPLTGLGNRRAFDEAAASLISRTRGSGSSPLSVVVADLDDFKQINDRYGHLVGDRCLREVANTIRLAMRGSELIYRWGGDEFAILLEGSNHSAASAVCERLTEAITTACSTPDGAAIRVACGCAQLSDGMDTDDLVAGADLALMARKHERPASTPRPSAVTRLTRAETG
ncbi:MAG: GGDEF domain-containing protein [Thermoleophilaceae bacterium]|nr:GGDEF domain-containing protein [Thermoleophilaceae bacterium]